MIHVERLVIRISFKIDYFIFMVWNFGGSNDGSVKTVMKRNSQKTDVSDKRKTDKFLNLLWKF